MDKWGADQQGGNVEPRYPETEGFLISNSSLETFFRCGALYWKRRAEKRRIVTVPMAIGTAVARGAEADNLFKSQGFKPQRLAELVNLTVAAYEAETSENEVAHSSRVEIRAAVDDVAEATRAYSRDISVNVLNPLLVEEAVIADLGNGLKLAGTPDVIEHRTVRDLKTGQPWTQARTDRSRQLTAYDILYEAQYGHSPARVAIDTISRARGAGKLWNGTTIWSSRTEREREAFVECTDRAKKAIEHGDALPAAEGAWWCGGKWCEFWEGCEVRPGA